MKEESIPLNLASEELLVRGIFHPLFYSDSKGRLKPQAFLPPPGKKDVSVLRLSFTDSNFCKTHMCSLNMGGSLYKGLAVVKCNTVDNANEEVGDNDPPPEWKVGVVASPMENLLMHADILYSKPVERGKPAVVLNQIVTRIIAGAATYIDPNADAKGWTGEELKAPK